LQRHNAGLQRGQAEGLKPVLADDIGLDALTDKRLKKWVGRRQRDTSELPFGQVAQAWTEAEAKRGAENEDVIRGAAGIRIVRVDLQQRAMCSNRRERTAPRGSSPT